MVVHVRQAVKFLSKSVLIPLSDLDRVLLHLTSAAALVCIVQKRITSFLINLLKSS